MLAAPQHRLFGFEAREHTAQVDNERRKAREKRFRCSKVEEDDLKKRAADLRKIAKRPPAAAVRRLRQAATM